MKKKIFWIFTSLGKIVFSEIQNGVFDKLLLTQSEPIYNGQTVDSQCTRVILWSRKESTSKYILGLLIKFNANGRNFVGQQHATLLGPTCCIRLHDMLALVVTSWMLLRVLWLTSQTFGATNPKFLLFCDQRSVIPTCRACFHGTHNNVGSYCVRFHGLYCPRMQRLFRPSPTMLKVVASVFMGFTVPECNASSCRPSPTMLGSCCVRLHAPHENHQQLPALLDPTLSALVTSVLCL